MERQAEVRGFGRIKFFQKSGARLYIPERVRQDAKFPFKDGDVVKIEIGNSKLILRSVEWWEMLDWKAMPDAFMKLPENVKKKVMEARLI